MSTEPITLKEKYKVHQSIFSGKDSCGLWKQISKIKKWKTHLAVYVLGCKCQELESVVAELLVRVDRLEKKLEDSGNLRIG
jgi:hypothetical protein